MSAPTLINLPPPQSDPVTPSEMGPGTPNSTTTSMSELSTVAIKDGHRGHPHHHSHARPLFTTSTETAHRLDDERADRISRLAGLERVANVRQSSSASLPPGASASHPQGLPGYFDAPAPPQTQAKERSTVGSASATGSVGDRRTWASGSGGGSEEQYDATDKMSEDAERSSDAEYSDEGNASLVGFGEGASSTVSGPVSMAPGVPRTPQRQGTGLGIGSPHKHTVMKMPMRDDTHMSDAQSSSGTETADRTMGDEMDGMQGGMTRHSKE